MKVPRRPLFLAPGPYRRRRLAEVARMLPVLGLFLMLLPILWQPAESASRDTAPDGLFLFGVWAGLILAAGLIAPRLSRDGDEAADAEDAG